MAEVIHGHYVNFLTGKCRCDACRDANRREQKRFRCFGPRNEMVDAAPVHAHIEALLAAGMSFNALTKAAGYASRNSLREVQQRRRVRASTAARILAVQAEAPRTGGQYVDGIASTRRLQALAVMGWTSRELAARLGMDHSALLDIQAGERVRVRAATANRISALFDSLALQHGGSKRTAGFAAKRGWLPPLAWDDATIGLRQRRVERTARRQVAA